MAVPVAREALVGVVLALGGEELPHARVAALDLVAPRPAVVGEEVAAAARSGEVDEPAERVRRVRDAVRRVLDVEVQDDAGPRLARPGEHRLVVALDQSHRPVDDVHAVLAQVGGGVGEEAARRSRGT